MGHRFEEKANPINVFADTDDAVVSKMGEIEERAPNLRGQPDKLFKQAKLELAREAKSQGAR